MPTNHFTGKKIPVSGDALDLTEILTNYALSGHLSIEVETLSEADAVRQGLDAIGHYGAIKAYVREAGVTYLHKRSTTGAPSTGVEGWEHDSGRQEGMTAYIGANVPEAAHTSIPVTTMVRTSDGWTVAGSNVTPPEQSGFYMVTAEGTLSAAAATLGRVYIEIECDGKKARSSGANENVLSHMYAFAMNPTSKVRVNVYHATGGDAAFSGEINIVQVASPAWHRI